MLEVLVENKLKNQNKYFGRNKFLNSVIFDGNESHIGKLIKVNIEKQPLAIEGLGVGIIRNPKLGL